ncbi:MAG: helix-turn-helix domain-containing protein [Actinomycetes bacterium]
MAGNSGPDFEGAAVDELVPPRRLGALLSEARVARGYSLEDAASRTGGRLSSVALLEAETGHRRLDDRDLAAVADLYGISTTDLVPARAELVIDLNEGTISAGREGAQIAVVPDAEDREEILARYLTLVYSMRRTPPGTSIPLRVGDMAILAETLGVSVDQVSAELRTMMAPGSLGAAKVQKRHRRLRGRVLVPAIGVIVAATAVGTLLMVPQQSGANSTDKAGVNGAVVPAPQIGDAIVVERNPDGSPGAVTPAVPAPEIGDAVVVERNPDGTPGSVVERN